MRGIGRSGGREPRRPGAVHLPVGVGAAAVLALAVLASGCTVAFRDPGVVAGCGPLRYTLDTADVSLSAGRRAAIHDAVEEFATLVGRVVVEVTAGSAADGAAGDPVRIVLAWPEESPDGLGFAEPQVVGTTYVGGWIMLNPSIRSAPAGLIRRLVLHELGHLHGLDDVTDPGELMDPSLAATNWGPGDLFGLAMTHGGGCEGSLLSSEFQALAS
ncbi:MAG: hypothetical protein R2707_15875 [Acidimicrobiales bacterium]